MTAGSTGRMTTTAMLLVIVAALTMSPGCTVLLGQSADPIVAKPLSTLRYPGDAPWGNDLDIVAVQDGGRLRLTNRSATKHEKVVIWLNQQYATTIKQLYVGPGQSVSLSRFINRHEESFPTGGFLTPEDGYPVVAVDLYNPDTGLRHRLLARSRNTRSY